MEEIIVYKDDKIESINFELDNSRLDYMFSQKINDIFLHTDIDRDGVIKFYKYENDVSIIHIDVIDCDKALIILGKVFKVIRNYDAEKKEKDRLNSIDNCNKRIEAKIDSLRELILMMQLDK